MLINVEKEIEKNIQKHQNEKLEKKNKLIQLRDEKIHYIINKISEYLSLNNIKISYIDKNHYISANTIINSLKINIEILFFLDNEDIKITFRYGSLKNTINIYDKLKIEYQKNPEERCNIIVDALTSLIKAISSTSLQKEEGWKNLDLDKYTEVYTTQHLIGELESDKELLNSELYFKTKNNIQKHIDVLILKENKCKHNLELRNKIIEEEKKKYELKINRYNNKTQKICKQISEYYFEPWALDIITYLPQHISINVSDESNIPEVINEFIFQDACFPASFNNVRKIISKDGCITYETLSNNIVKIQHLKFDKLPTQNFDYWKKYYIDIHDHKHFVCTKPGVEIDWSKFKLPKHPATWEVNARKRGVEIP